MNKAELITKVAERVEGVTKKQSEAFVNAFIETVQDTLQANDKVQLVGFGTFTPRKRAARTAINPKDPSGAKVEVPERIVPVFKPGKVFKNKLNS